MNFRKISTLIAVAAFSLATGFAQARAPEGNNDGINNVVATKGVSKEDLSITNAIAQKVLQDEQNTNWIVKTSTKNGVVTFVGYVETDAAKQKVSDIAKNTKGVKSVNNEIKVGKLPEYKEPVTLVTGAQEDAEREASKAK